MAHISVLTTPTPLPYQGEQGVFLQNLGSVDVYLDFDASVATTTGVKLVATGGTLLIAKQLNEDGGPLFLISATTGQDVRYILL
jgi:hypothetical protein